MLFSRVLSLITLFVSTSLTSTVAASATPLTDIVADKRQDAGSGIMDILTTLKASTDVILPQIGALAGGGNSSTDEMTTLFGQLTDALNDAKTSISELQSSGSSISARQIVDIAALANLLAGIITDIVTTLTAIGDLPILQRLIPGIDVALAEILAAVGLLLEGVLTLVRGLLLGLAGLLTPFPILGGILAA
ncbi:hypothetical protein ONZ45_g12327 [Pleurotus djamor]|nr:hypothetical protein ONZ45_g12327 [Pleurotus djamor]